MIKKFIIGLGIGASLALAPFAFANMTFSPPSPLPVGSNPIITCDNNSYVFTVFQNGAEYDGNVSCSSGLHLLDVDTYNTTGTYTFVECDPSAIGSLCSSGFSTIGDAQADPGYISTSVLVLNSVSNLRPAGFGIKVLGGTTDNTGHGSGYTLNGSNLTANLADSTQTTFSGMGSIVALVGGLILAFISIEWILNTIKMAQKSKE